MPCPGVWLVWFSRSRSRAASSSSDPTSSSPSWPTPPSSAWARTRSVFYCDVDLLQIWISCFTSCLDSSGLLLVIYICILSLNVLLSFCWSYIVSFSGLITPLYQILLLSKIKIVIFSNQNCNIDFIPSATRKKSGFRLS